jgi:hypothetical protein
MSYKNARITKLKEYLADVIGSLLKEKNFKINANMLSKNINNYSLDKIPTSSVVETTVIGTRTYRDVFSFRSRREYSMEEINNLSNIGFFEKFEKIIIENNENDVLPQIEGIESIQCLNCGTMNNAGTNTAEFDIQIQITYEV